MARTAHKIALTAAAAALALPAAAADAAHPKPGYWDNNSSSNGAEMTTTRHTVRDLRFFCQRNSYDLKDWLHVRKNGTFSFHGVVRRWGPIHQWFGDYKVRLSGRFVTPKKVVIKRTVGRCGTNTVTVTR